jgi:hypothetical protein
MGTLRLEPSGRVTRTSDIDVYETAEYRRATEAEVLLVERRPRDLLRTERRCW